MINARISRFISFLTKCNIRDAICSSSIFGDSDMTGLLVLAFVSYRVKGLVDNGRGSEMSAIEIYRYACDI